MIDAEFRSEERFARLALAYENEEEKKRVNECVDRTVAKHSFKPEVYTTKVSNGKEVLVIKYHDDINRECCEIFDVMIKDLNIKVCK